MYKDITPSEAKKLIEENKNVKIIDVREKWEYDIANLEDSMLFPLSTFEDNLDKLNKDDDLLIICHHGMRSRKFCNYLSRLGYKKLFNLAGGIDAWSDEIDSSVPKY